MRWKTYRTYSPKTQRIIHLTRYIKNLENTWLSMVAKNSLNFTTMLQKTKITHKQLQLLIYKDGKNRNRSNEIIQDTYTRGMTQKDLHNLIKETNNGESVSMYILNEIINGKRTNFNINTLKPIKKALNVSYDDLIDD